MTEMTHLPGDDPGQEIADRLLAEVSDELGTDDVAHAFGHITDPTAVGHLVRDATGTHPEPADETADDLSAEEAAVHLVDLEEYDAALDEGDETRF
jgi:hypothetical protein